MKESITSRVLSEAKYLIDTKQTVREVAKYFKVSKSTVHKDLHERLIKIDEELYKKVKIIMQNHLEERHIRGGESTKQKYLKLK